MSLNHATAGRLDASAARMLAAARIADLQANPKRALRCLRQAERMDAHLTRLLAEADGEGKVLNLRGARAQAIRNPSLIATIRNALGLLDDQCAVCRLCPARLKPGQS